MRIKKRNDILQQENLDLKDKISKLEKKLSQNDRLNIRTEKVLKESAVFKTLINISPSAIVQTTTGGIVELINDGFTREFGYKPKEAIGRHIDDLIVPGEQMEEASTYTDRIAKNEIINTDTYRISKDGERKYVNMVLQPITEGNTVKSLYAIYTNIANKKKDDDTKSVIYNISAAALTMTDYSDIFNSIKEEIGKVWDTKNFYIVLYNKDSQTLSLPFYQDEKDYFEEIPVKNTITGWLLKENKPSLLTEKDIDELEAEGEVALVGTPCKVWLGVPLSIENEIIGAMVLQDYHDENIFNKDDLRLLSLIGNQIALAIQRKRMLNNLIIERRKAEEAAKLKQQFMSTMSHEIRTPLNEVIGITNLLLDGKPRDDQMEYIKTLRFSANHLLTLVNDVLDYTKMESGSINFEKATFNIFEFLDEIRRSYSFRTESKGLQFSFDVDKKIPANIIGDPIRLNQILSNLLSNAIKFTPEGSVGLEVREISRKNKEVNINFSVKDTGIGIAKDKQSIIFDSFKQASDDTTRKFGGTGLGLPISKKLVELQGGSLSVDSNPEEGSNFFFSIKFTIAAAEEDKEKIGEEEEKWDELKGKKVLIAEDNKINFFVANKFLKKWEINVTHAENGREAIDAIKDNDFDLILMDLHMPEMDGIEATEIIRKSDDPEISSLPVIALTAAIMSEHEAQIEKLKINDYILKPFKPRDLYTKILKHTK
ncbi:MAG: response regulator [Bacteroidales bacterium]|nr:response regulator [Bacteroidales bacterium]